VQALLGPGARIVKELGDGLMLWFAAAADAVRTCLRLQDEFEEAASIAGAPLGLRIGLHTGRQVRRRDDLVGHDVNVAARVAAVAGAGEVLASAATVGSAGAVPGVTFEELGPVMMKGIPDPVELFLAARSPFPA